MTLTPATTSLRTSTVLVSSDVSSARSGSSARLVIVAESASTVPVASDGSTSAVTVTDPLPPGASDPGRPGTTADAGRQLHLPRLGKGDTGRFFYWWQLRDLKGSAEIEMMAPRNLRFYAGLRGYTLARAHARSGDLMAIAAYLGSKDRFDRSICDFSGRYADQNERDFAAFTDAINTGRLDATPGV